MVLSIKDAEADKLARKLSQTMGQSITQVIILALKDRLEKEMAAKKMQSDRLVAEAMRIGQQFAMLPMLDNRSLEDMLYDERGLPK